MEYTILKQPPIYILSITQLNLVQMWLSHLKYVQKLEWVLKSPLERHNKMAKSKMNGL